MKKYIVAALVIGATAFSVIGPFPGGPSSGGGGVTSINGDTTAAQTIVGAGSVSVGTAAGVTTVTGAATSFPLLGTAGTPGAPTYSFAGGAGFGDKGMYSSSASELGFSIDGTKRAVMGNDYFELLGASFRVYNTAGSLLAFSVDATIPEFGTVFVDGTSARFVMKQIATPSNVSAGYDSLYFKSDDFLYKRTSAGVESKIEGISALTSDVTASGPGSAVATLATVNGNVGSFTSANITVNAKGLITAAANGSSTPGGSDTQVQFNDAGTLAGSAKFTFNKTAPQLLVDGDGFSSSLSAFNSAVGLTYATITAATLGSHNANVQADDTANGPTLDNYTSRGTFASPTQHLNGDTLGGVLAVPWDGTGTFSSGFASFSGLMGMNLLASENHTTTAMGSKIDFYTTPNGTTTLAIPLTLGGSTAAVSANNGTSTADMLRLNNNGVVGLRFTDSNELKIAEDGTPANILTTSVGGLYARETMSGATKNFFIQAGDQTDASIVLATAATAKSLTITQNSDGSVTLLQNSNGAIKPGTNASMDFGASTEAFRKIYAGTGTAASPTYSFGQAAGQEDNGMWLSGTDQLGFSTAGVDRWDISSAGHLLCAADGVYDIGAAGASRPSNVHIKTSVVLATSDTTEVGSVTTSNATQTTGFTKAMLDNTVYECEADIAARRTDAADRAGYKIMVTAYREAAGGCTIQGTVDSAHAAESDASWDATFTCSGNDLLVSVTGAAAKTVDWTSTVHCKYAQ